RAAFRTPASAAPSTRSRAWVQPAAPAASAARSMSSLKPARRKPVRPAACKTTKPLPVGAARPRRRTGVSSMRFLPLSSGKLALALMGASSLVLSACATPVAGPSGLYSQPTGDAPVVPNPTPYSAALVCEAEYARAHNLNAPRLAIGRIADYTGKLEADGSGRKITQGASLMAMSAFAKAGVPLVERYDTSVSELELKYANSRLISDSPVKGGHAPAEYRQIMAGQVPGSDFYIAGGVTELNFNIRSNGVQAAGGSNWAAGNSGAVGQVSGSTYVMNVGLDLRLVNTRT